jgi:hypothetical protein
MTDNGTAERIFIAPEAEAEMCDRSEIEAVAGSGLRGDRYFDEIETGTFVEWEPDEQRLTGYDLTLIEQEAIEAIEREANVDLVPGEHLGISRPVTWRSIISLGSGSESVKWSVAVTDCVNPATTSNASPKTEC